MPEYSIKTRGSSEQEAAIETVADLTPGVRVITSDSTAEWRDGSHRIKPQDWTDEPLLTVRVECETVEDGNKFLRSLDTFGLLR